MSEQSSGENDNLSESAKQGSLIVIHKEGGLLENTIGRLGSVPLNLLLGTPDSILKNVSKEQAEKIEERLKDVPWKGQVEMYLNHSPFLHQMKRLFEKERRTNLFLRVMSGIPTTVYGAILGRLMRVNSYNPFTESAQVYHPHLGVALHEAGHAEDFDQAQYPGIRSLVYGLPIGTSKLEWNASHNAMKHLKGDERTDARKILEPAFGSYLGGEPMKLFKMMSLPIPRMLNILPLIGVLAGHMHSRMSKNNLFLPNEKTQPIPSFSHATVAV